MTFGFALLTIGAIWLIAGVRGQSVAEVLSGTVGTGSRLTFTDSSGAGEFVSSIAGAAGDIRGEGGLTTFDGTRMCKWIASELQWARQNGWTGGVNSGHRSDAEQARVCAEVPPGTPCAKPGQSNHRGTNYPGCAVDVSKPDELDRVLSRKPGRRLKWTGRSIGDDPHFSSGMLGV